MTRDLWSEWPEKVSEQLKEALAELPELGFFRLSRKADPDALVEADTGRGVLSVRPTVDRATYWGSLLCAAKDNREVVIPSVDCATAWCIVKAGMRAMPMKQPPVPPKRIAPASEKWAIIMPETFARKRVQPYFEMDLAGEMTGISLLEYLVTFGGIAPALGRAAAERYRRVRKGDPLRLDKRDVEGLLAAAEGREAALAQDSETP